MAIAKIYELGDQRGTIREFAEAYGVERGTMKNRITRHLRGKIRLEDVLVEGLVETTGKNGNEMWRALPDPICGRPENLKKIKVGIFDHLGYHEEGRWEPSASGVPVGDFR